MGPTSSSVRLERYIGYLLRRAYVRAEQAASIAVPPPYAMRHLSVLALLSDHGPMSQQKLSTLTQVNRTIMVQLIDTLENEGLVRRERDTKDRRSYALLITMEGRATLREFTPAIDRTEALLTANLDDRQRARLAELLGGLLATHIGGALAGRCGYLIVQAHKQLRTEGTERLAPLGLDPRHLAALTIVERNQPCSQEVVAKDLAVSAPVVVELVDDLVESDFVVRRRNSDDRRRYDLTVTDSGRIGLRRGVKVLDDIDDELRARLTARGVDELRVLLSALIDPPLTHPTRPTL
ncbi:MAG: MarR family transcriptional regulator [Mycobacteriaceae bacterium]|nr:MarR family transcriptional regulator [Mycobacteriaceae bacterium]